MIKIEADPINETISSSKCNSKQAKQRDADQTVTCN